jgi:hypothetical protein
MLVAGKGKKSSEGHYNTSILNLILEKLSERREILK